MSKKENSKQQPTGKPTNNPGGRKVHIKGSVPTMRNPPSPPKKKD